MIWLLFLFLATVCWTVYDILFKAVGNSTNYFLSLFIIGFFQMILAAPFIIYAYYTGSLNYSGRGIYLSALMGALLGIGTIFFFYVFKSGTPLAVALPVYYVGSLLIATAAGLLVFKETLTPMIFAGLVLGVISIILLAAK